jgi:hypothetical protein
MNMKMTVKMFLVVGMACADVFAMQPSMLPCAGEQCKDNDNETAPAWNFFVNALYWHPNEEGLDYMVRNDAGAVFVNKGTVERAEFDWNGGFRVGVGYCDTCCPVGVSAYYTRFTADGCNKLTTTYPTVLFPVWSNPSTNVVIEQEAQAKLCLSLNMVDLQLNTVLSPNSCVNIMPVLGVRYARIRQNFNINANGGQTQGPFGFVLDDAITMKSKFEGFGPKCGVATTWGSWCGVSLFGSLELALLYGKFMLSQKETMAFSNDVPATTFLDIACNKFNITRPAMGLVLGLQWESAWDCYEFALSAGWENQFFFGQNQWLRFVDDLNPGVNVAGQGDLAMQGLTAALNISF